MAASTSTSTAAGRGGLVDGRFAYLQPQAVVLAAILQLLPRVTASSPSPSIPAVYPYTPTTILVPTTNTSTVYIFSPNADGQVEFLAVDISSTLSASSTSTITTLTQGVPFLANNGQENTETTYTPSLRSDGSVFVFAGSCSSGDAATLWTYTPSNDTSSAAEWISIEISLSSSQTGPWFLGASTAFSSQIAPTVSNSTFYLYGGMCPTDTSSSSSTATTTGAATATPITASNWQNLASYTNKMMKLVPGTDKYTATTVSTKGPPVAEAGFSFTTLSASIANRSGIVTQQVTSVVLGGHTQSAFVNMSTAAIWSLPEEAWSFVTIANPSPSTTSPGTELAVVRKSDSSTSAPDSRSGHTAVLSEDGNSLVVLGGWVGDVGQAADPQMAILEMGPDYDQWQWVIPDAQPSGSGMYGHGAALLPGNVMLVYGGYNITSASSASSAKLIRQDSASDSGLMFFNLTSQAWLEDYTNPNSVDLSGNTAPTSNSSYTSSSKIGIGVGLGLGIPLAILVIALVVRSCRRHRRRTKRRHDAVQALAESHQHQHFLNNHDEMIDTGHGSLPFNWIPQEPLGFYTGGHDPYSNVGRKGLGFESLRGAKQSPAFPSYESPKMGAEDAGTFTTLRKPSRNVARGMYQPTTINDYDAMMSGGAGPGVGAAGIHPIYEAEEEEEDEHINGKSVQRRPTTHGATDSTTGRSISPETAEDLIDPFLTPTSQTIAAGSSPLRSSYAGAFGPATLNLNPFVRNTPSPEATGPSRPPPVAGGSKAGPATTVGQDRDVQEWVSGLEIEDLLFSPPAPGASAAIEASVSPGPGQTCSTGTPRDKTSPNNTTSNRRMSLRSKPSNGGSPTRSSFFGAGTAAAAAAVAGAMAGVTGWAGKEDEARTESNLSDKSALTFVSRTGSSHSRMNAGVSGGGDNKGSSSDSVSASFNTAPSGFHSLRAEGPTLLYGKSHPNDGSAGGSSGTSGNSGTAGTASAPNSVADSVSGSVRTQTNSPVHYNLRAAPVLHSQGLGLSSYEYGGAAAVHANEPRRGHGHQRSRTLDESDENTGLTGGTPGSPSKSKPRRTWMGNLMRIFSSSSPAHNTHGDMSGDAEALDSSMGTGAQQGPNYQNMAHATLLRRKQGRSDWEADEWREEESTAVGAIRSGGRTASLSSVHGFGHGHTLSRRDTLAHGHSRSLSHGAAATAGMGLGDMSGGPATSGLPASGSVAAGRREGSGKSDDWDVEKAVQNRVVQVMFTMPRDQLRVVNAEVERDEDEADAASSQTSAPAKENTDNVHDTDTLSIRKRRRTDQNNTDSGDPGLSAPIPPPNPHTPYQSYRSMSPIHSNAAVAAKAELENERYRAMPPPPELGSPTMESPGSPESPDHLSHSSIKRQDDHMREMHEALAESKRLLSGQHLAPWVDDCDPRPRSYLSNTDDETEVHEAEAQAVLLNSKGKVVDVSWMNSSSAPAPLTPKNTPRSSTQITPTGAEAAQRQKTVADEYTLATAAALARTLLAARKPQREQGESASAATAATIPRVSVGGPRTTMPSKLAESALSPSARAIPTRPASPAKMSAPTTPSTPNRGLASASTRSRQSLKAPAQTSAKTPAKTPTKEASNDSLATSASVSSRRSTKSVKSTMSNKSGFVAGMVDRIETSSPSRLQ